MRRRVFLVMALSLLMGFMKGSTPQSTPAPSNTTTPSTAGNIAETNPAPSDPTTLSTPAGTTTQSTSVPSDPTTPSTPGSTPQSTPAPSDTTTPSTAGSTPQSTPAPSDTTTPSTPAGTTPQSTPAPSNTTTPSTAAGTTTQSTPAPSDTTTPSTPGSTIETTTATTIASTPGGFCSGDPCGRTLATCVALFSNFTCLCPYGFYYSEKDCYRGKIFPGVLKLSLAYSDEVQIITSEQYETVFQNVTALFKEIFPTSTGFEQTVIVEIQSQTQARSSLPMNITVINVFKEDTNETNVTVAATINSAKESISYIVEYNETSYCAVYNCDTNTTVCMEDMFPKCECKSEYSKSEWDDRSCSDCNAECSAENHKYCAKQGGVPQCKCMPNYEKKSERCVPCGVGYSGEDCINNSELILIIVGSVLGAIVLCLLIAVIVVSARAKHRKDPERKSLIKSGYSNSNASDDKPATMFPRVQTTSGHSNPGYQPNNPYEMPSSNRDRFPERDYDDLYEISREPEGFRMRRY
ncbi:mucin-13 isoform X5 [Colius striatus]|uniref:mucin-13 isoform X5 n=1 Tax=Colius striatus TaxID=57412 RepID=UPI002B1E48D5|nr:mucin-13 isoform X5 [Colius striatus]